MKKGVVTLALTGSFILGAGALNNAIAQNPRETRRNGQVESTGNIDRNRNGIDDRYEANGKVDLNRNGMPDSQEPYGRYDRDRRYGNRGYNNADYQRGYRDGLSRGRDDARTHRAMTPNNSEHFRNGNPSYRAGFEKGFYEAYRANRGRRY
jgi:hypothetical protein